MRELLCPEISLTDIIKRCEVIKEQLQCPIDIFVEFKCTPKYKLFLCDCGNTNEQHVGVCLFESGKPWTFYITTPKTLVQILETSFAYNWVKGVSRTSTIEHDTSEIYSPQAQPMSKWKKSNKCSGLNLAVEHDVVKFGRGDTLTSDLYKDEQRTEVYSLLDQECIACINYIRLFAVCCTLICKLKQFFKLFFALYLLLYCCPAWYPRGPIW